MVKLVRPHVTIDTIIFIILEKSEQKFRVYLLYYVLTTQFPLYLTWTICKNLEKVYWHFVMQCVNIIMRSIGSLSDKNPFETIRE